MGDAGINAGIAGAQAGLKQANTQTPPPLAKPPTTTTTPPPAAIKSPLTVVSVNNGQIHWSDGSSTSVAATPTAPAQGVKAPPVAQGPLAPGETSVPITPAAKQSGALPNIAGLSTLLPNDQAQVAQLVAAANQNDPVMGPFLSAPLKAQFDAGIGNAVDKAQAYASTVQKMNNYTALANGGAGGVKFIQSLLNKNGYNVPNDGVANQSTQDAWTAYSNSQVQAATEAKNQAYQQIDPYTLRAQGNAQLEEHPNNGPLSHTELQRQAVTQHFMSLAIPIQE